MLVMEFGCNSGSSCRRVGFDDVIWGCRVDATEPKQKTMIAQCIPPPFAAEMSRAAMTHQCAALRETKLMKAMKAIAEADED